MYEAQLKVNPISSSLLAVTLAQIAAVLEKLLPKQQNKAALVERDKAEEESKLSLETAQEKATERQRRPLRVIQAPLG